MAGAATTMTDPARRSAAFCVVATAAALFALLLTFLALQMRAGADPALGAGTPVAATPPAPRPVLIRKVIVRRVVEEAPEPAAAPAGAAGSAAAAAAPAPAPAAPAAVSAPAPAPASAPVTTGAS